MSLVLTEIDRGVGIVTLNRADKHNAFDDALIAALTDAVRALAAEPAVRVLVLSAAGESFCAGADLGWMRKAAGYTEAENRADAMRLAQLLDAIDRCPKPTVARVQGPAYGGGVGLIAACDIAVGTSAAQFALSEVKLGLIPAVISPYVIAAIGARHARRYMLTAGRFSAAEAYRIGLLQELVPDEDALDDTVGAIVDALLAAGPQALSACKDLIAHLAGAPRDQALMTDTAVRIARARASEEGREGIAAFLERRKPAWVTDA